MKTQSHHKLRLVTLCLCAFAVFWVAGCDTSPAERVTVVKNAISQVTDVSQFIDTGIADLERVIADSQLLLQDPNIPEESKPVIEKFLTEASVRLAKLKQEKQKISDVLARYQAILDKVDPNSMAFEDEIQLYSIGVSEVSKFLPQPYRSYILLGTSILALLGGSLKILNQKKQLNEGKSVLVDIITSVDTLLNSSAIANPKEAKQILRSKQAGKTSDIVDAVHDPLKNTGPTK